jgi:hypothetical protein
VDRHTDGEAPVAAHREVRSELGGISLEWLAVAALVVVVLGAIVTTNAAQRMGESFAYAACRVISTVADVGGCTAPGDGGGPTGPTAEPVTITCLDSRTSENAGGNVTLFSARVDSDLAYQIDRMSDGTYDVTLQFSGGLAAEAMAGGKLGSDELGFREGRQGSIRAGAGGEIAPVYSFDDLQQAEDFAGSARDLVAGPMDDAWDLRTLIPFYGPGRIAYNQYDRISSFEPPPPSRLRVEGGIDIAADGSLYRSGAGVEGLLSRGQSLGADIDLETGHTTVYVALDGEVAGQLGLDATPARAAGGAGGSGQLDGEVVVAVTVDEDLNPTELGIGATLSGSGGFTGFGDADLEGIFAGFDGDLGVDLQSEQHDAFALSGTATLDLTDPRAGEVGNGLLDALRSASPSDLAAAGGDLRDHLQTQTDLEAQLHVGDRGSFGFDAAGGKGLTFGFGFETGRSDMEFAGAWHRPPGGSFGEALCG